MTLGVIGKSSTANIAIYRTGLDSVQAQLSSATTTIVCAFVIDLVPHRQAISPESPEHRSVCMQDQNDQAAADKAVLEAVQAASLLALGAPAAVSDACCALLPVLWTGAASQQFHCSFLAALGDAGSAALGWTPTAAGTVISSQTLTRHPKCSWHCQLDGQRKARRQSVCCQTISTRSRRHACLCCRCYWRCVERATQPHARALPAAGSVKRDLFIILTC